MKRAISLDEETDPGSTIWHLCWQAAMGREFFVDPSLQARIRERVIDAHRRPGRVLLDYTLLPTEIHVVAEIPPCDSAGAVARAIGNVVARWVRAAQPMRNPVFAGTYRAHPIRSEAELRTEIRMLAWRAVVLGRCTTPLHHAHGALRIALGLSPAQGFDARPMLGVFGNSVRQARAGLRAWVKQRPAEQQWREWELTRGLASTTDTIGFQRTFVRKLRSPTAAALMAAGRSDGIDGALDLLGTWVAVQLGAPGVLDLRTASNGTAARGRALVGCLALRHRLCSAASVARHFGRAKATLSEQMSACRARPADRAIVTTPVHRIIDDVTAPMRQRHDR